MQIDLEQIRRHYASLSDEALLDINRDDLTPAAQQCFDAEFKERGLSRRKAFAARATVEPRDPSGEDEDDEAADDDAEIVAVEPDSGAAPDWLGEAAQVYSVIERPGASHAADADHARGILDDAGIPCRLELTEIDETTSEWRLLVPGNLNMQATSVLDRDLFNEEFESQWRAHLEEFSDDELAEMRPEVVFCGLFDRIERVVRSYDEEIERRGLKAE